MDAAFRRSFEKDLGKLRNETLLKRIRAEIEAVEAAETLQDVTNLKSSKAKTVTIASELESIESG